MIDNIVFTKITADDYEELTEIMTRAFNQDTNMHTDLKEDGPVVYNDRNIGCLMRGNIKKTYIDVEKWIVETPKYSKKNIYFYTEKCGFILTAEKTYEDGEKSYIFEKKSIR